MDIKTDNESDTEEESKSDTENQDLMEIINNIKSTFNYSLQLRKKFRKKLENMEEYDQDEWKKILKRYAELEASVKDENDGLDRTEDQEKDDEDEDEEEGGG